MVVTRPVTMLAALPSADAVPVPVAAWPPFASWSWIVQVSPARASLVGIVIVSVVQRTFSPWLSFSPGRSRSWCA
jgi:hypothetical protein